MQPLLWRQHRSRTPNPSFASDGITRAPGIRPSSLQHLYDEIEILRKLKHKVIRVVRASRACKPRMQAPQPGRGLMAQTCKLVHDS
jgi:hypothetical protein